MLSYTNAGKLCVFVALTEIETKIQLQSNCASDANFVLR